MHCHPLSVIIEISERLILEGSHRNSTTGNRILRKVPWHLCILGIRFRNPIDLLIRFLFALVTWILESEVPDYFYFSVDQYSQTYSLICKIYYKALRISLWLKICIEAYYTTLSNWKWCTSMWNGWYNDYVAERSVFRWNDRVKH